jgi:hypothetical protein
MSGRGYKLGGPGRASHFRFSPRSTLPWISAVLARLPPSNPSPNIHSHAITKSASRVWQPVAPLLARRAPPRHSSQSTASRGFPKANFRPFSARTCFVLHSAKSTVTSFSGKATSIARCARRVSYSFAGAGRSTRLSRHTYATGIVVPSRS